MPAIAIAKRVMIYPRKAGVVVDLVRGRSVADALVILDHTPRRSAKTIKETIKCAQANATHDHNLKPESLQITSITVTPGPRYKRYRPAARGRALPYARQTSHIRVEVDGVIRTIKKPAASLTEKTSQTNEKKV